MSFYPTNSTHGYIYTSSEGNITRHDTILDKMPPGSIRVTTSNVVMSRVPATVSLITVDWVNDMFYWLEVNDTDAAVSALCMCVCVCVCVYVRVCIFVPVCTCVYLFV